MCTAVVGGSIHRAAPRISAANDQRSTTPMTSHRMKDRRKPVRSGVLVCVFGIAVTFQNNSLGWVAADGMILCARTQSAAFYSGHSGQSPLVLDHIELHYKDKVGSVPRLGLGDEGPPATSRGEDMANLYLPVHMFTQHWSSRTKHISPKVFPWKQPGITSVRHVQQEWVPGGT